MDIISKEKNELPLSKTQRKRAMEELQALGEALATLPVDRLKKISLPDDLRESISAVQRMTRHDEARRRQMQYIGRLMRSADAEPIRAALAEARSNSLSETTRLHRMERMRSELLADERSLAEIVARYPCIDLQHLRSLRRAALKEQEQNKPARNFRAIFQLLKDAEQSITDQNNDS